MVPAANIIMTTELYEEVRLMILDGPTKDEF